MEPSAFLPTLYKGPKILTLGVAKVVSVYRNVILVVMNGKPGRPSKGQRERVVVRQPTELNDAALARAAGLGLTMTDYVNLLVSQDVGVPYGDQEGLRLSA